MFCVGSVLQEQARVSDMANGSDRHGTPQRLINNGFVKNPWLDLWHGIRVRITSVLRGNFESASLPTSMPGQPSQACLSTLDQPTKSAQSLQSKCKGVRSAVMHVSMCATADWHRSHWSRCRCHAGHIIAQPA